MKDNSERERERERERPGGVVRESEMRSEVYWFWIE
jgi:hypothetical protein